MKLSFNFICVNLKKSLQCWKQYENSDIMFNEDIWYNLDIRIDNNIV